MGGKHIQVEGIWGREGSGRDGGAKLEDRRKEKEKEEGIEKRRRRKENEIH